MGGAAPSSEDRLTKLSDSGIEERKQRILSQLAAPVLRKTLNFDLATSTCVGGHRTDTVNRHGTKIPESPGHKNQVPVPPGSAEEQNECDWYVSAVSPSLGSTVHRSDSDSLCANSPICLEAMLPEQIVRQMPNCTHMFHQQCCEDWIWKTLKRWDYPRLGRPLVCPVCRADLEPRKMDAIKKPAPVASLLGSRLFPAGSLSWR